jgi:hypothetical protein
MDDCFGVKYVQIKNKLVPIMCFQRPHTPQFRPQTQEDPQKNALPYTYNQLQNNNPHCGFES